MEFAMAARASDFVVLKASYKNFIQALFEHAHTHTHAAYFNVCKTSEWWRKLAAVHQLLKPFSEAIHALEADKALLSQVHPALDALEAHVSKWAARADLTQALRKDV
eukprot:scaffold95212_cov14-Tisochrysis_lutea.AAC.1